MKGKKASAAAASGAVALIFMILGFQAAIFTGNVFKFRQAAKAEAAAGTSSGDDSNGDRASAHGERSVAVKRAPTGASEGRVGKPELIADRSGGVWGRAPVSIASEPTGSSGEKGGAVRKALEASGQRERDYSDSRTVLAERTARKSAETFEFDPNVVTLEELTRLGFSERQAQVILNYRDKGGRFRSEQDFAKMYVVDSATFARLEPYIRIPKLDLNAADSEALLGLRGIGPYYASKILDYRRRLGGSFTSLDQLLEIDGFDRQRLDGFRSDVELRKPPKTFNLWEATQAQLEAHPYIGTYAAKGIIRFKRTVDTLSWTLSNLVEAGILSPEKAAKL